MNMVTFEYLKGKTLDFIEVVKGDNYCDAIVFRTTEGEELHLFHDQDCCESVELIDVCGDWSDLLNSEIVVAEEVTKVEEGEYESSTWTFYKLDTVKGGVTMRWYGTSNGYYSETVDLHKM